MNKIEIFTDGGSRGNPGLGAIGFVVREGENIVYKNGEKIGHCTNNEAEYQAVIRALEYVQNKYKKIPIQFYLDSELVVKQLNGEYRVKDKKLKVLFIKIREMIIALGGAVVFTHITREKNKTADALVNYALD